MSLIEDLVASATLLPAEEVVEANLVEARRARIRCQVSADSWMLLIGAEHHRRRIPAHDMADARLHRLVAREGWLIARLDRVDVRGGGECWEINAKVSRPRHQAHHQQLGPLRAVGGDRTLEFGDQARRIGGVRVRDLFKEIEGLHCPLRVAPHARMWG